MTKDFWQTVAKHLLTILVTGLFAWFAFGIDTVTRGSFKSYTDKQEVKDDLQNIKIQKVELNFAVFEQMLKQIGEDVRTIKNRSP
jgi:aminopeptidase-like protein